MGSKRKSGQARAYTVGTWAGRPNYRCGLCPFATLNAETLRAHMADRHGLTVAVVEPEERGEDVDETTGAAAEASGATDNGGDE